MGSATPSSLIRLCRVCIFCLIAKSCMRFCSTKLSEAFNTSSLPLDDSVKVRLGYSLAMMALALSNSASSLKLICTVSPSRLTPTYEMRSLRKTMRKSPTKRSAALLKAAFMSTCNKKCTPPRKSKPKYIGLAPTLRSQSGERESRLRATV